MFSFFLSSPPKEGRKANNEDRERNKGLLYINSREKVRTLPTIGLSTHHLLDP